MDIRWKNPNETHNSYITFHKNVSWNALDRIREKWFFIEKKELFNVYYDLRKELYQRNHGSLLYDR